MTGGHWHVCADQETWVWVPDGQDAKALERKVRGTAEQRWDDGLAADARYKASA